MGLFGVHVSFKMCIYVALALDDPHTKVNEGNLGNSAPLEGRIFGENHCDTCDMIMILWIWPPHSNSGK